MNNSSAPPPGRSRSILATSVVALIISSIPARAQTIWDGGGLNGDWSNAANWNNDTAPTLPQSLTFAGTTNLTTNNDFLAGSTVTEIAFSAGAGAFILGGNQINLGGNIVNDASGTLQTITLDLGLFTGTIVNIAADAGLTIGGAISGFGGLNKAGLGTLSLTGANTYIGTTSISTALPGGTVAVGAGGTLGDVSNQLLIGSGMNTGNLDLTANGATVGSLTVSSNTSAVNTITIGSGRTLAITGNVLVGGLSGNGSETRLTVTGSNGTLTVGNGNGGSFIVGNLAGGNNPNTATAVLDLSNVGTFSANYGPSGVIGIGTNPAGGQGNAAFGTLVLGANNTLTAGTLRVGFSITGNTSNGVLRLGAVNFINADTIVVGSGKTQPASFSGLLTFQGGLINPAVVIRGSDGTSRVTSVRISDYSEDSASSSSGTIGRIDFTAGSGGSAGAVDALISDLRIAIGKANANSGPSTGTLFFDEGTIDATTITLATRGTSAAAANTTGTLTVGGTGQLIVGTGGIILGNIPAGSQGTGVITGNLNINGGTVTVDGDIVDGGGISNVSLNGGTLDLAGHNLGTATGMIDNLLLQSGTLKNVAEINGGISGVVKNTPGTLVVAGANTYTGDTVINAGTLSVTGTLLPAGNVFLNAAATLSGTGSLGVVTMAAGANLRPGATEADGAAGTLTMESLTIGGGDLRFDLPLPAASDRVTVSGAANFTGSSVITPTGVPAAGTYTLLTAGTLTGIAPVFAAPAGTRGTFDLNFDTAISQITLTVGAAAKTLTWTGDNGSAWDVVSTFNWTDGAIAEQFFSLDSVVFANGPSNRIIALNTEVTPAAVTVNNNISFPYAISGSGGITGATGLAKGGDGTLILAADNTYSGPTTISGGTLQIGDGGAVGSLGSGAVTNNAILAFNHAGPLFISSDITGTGAVHQLLAASTVILTGSNSYGATTIDAGSTLQIGNFGTTGTLGTGAVVNHGVLAFNRSNTVTVESNITGPGELQQRGSGTLVLTGTVTDGPTTILAGTLQVGNGGTTGSLGNGIITNNSTLAFHRSDAITLNLPIEGIGTLQQVGPGTLIITAASSYSGPTSVVGGTLVIAPGATLGAGASPLNLGSAASSGILDLTSNSATASALTVSSNTAVPNSINLGSGKSLTINGNVTVGGLTGNNVTNLNVVGADATFAAAAPGGGSFFVSNLSNVANSATSRATLDLSALATFAADYTSTGTIGIGTAVFGGAGNGPNGTLILAASNTLTAGTLWVGYGATNGGTSHLRLGAANVLNADAVRVASGKGAGNLLFNPGLADPTVRFRGSDGTSRVAVFRIADYGDYASGGASTSATGTVNFNGGTVDALIDELTIGIGRIEGQDSGTGTAAGTLSFDKGIIDANSITLGKTGLSTLVGGSATGTLTVGGTGSLLVGAGGITLGDGVPSAAVFTGTLNINGGNVVVAGDITDGGGTSTVNLNGGTLDLQGHNLGGASGIDALNLQAGTLQNVAEINNGASGVTKTGAGALILKGANTYTGATSVLQGLLQVDSIAGTGSGSLTVSFSGVLGGTGSIRPGASNTIIVNAGGSVAPGASVGMLTLDSLATAVESVLSLEVGASLTFELNTSFQSDKIALINGSPGDILFNSNTINFVDLSAGNLAPGSYTLFTADIADAYLGFEGLNIGAGLEAYADVGLQRAGNDIVLVIVPEPAALPILLGGLGVLAGCRRARRHI